MPASQGARIQPVTHCLQGGWEDLSETKCERLKQDLGHGDGPSLHSFPLRPLSGPVPPGLSTERPVPPPAAATGAGRLCPEPSLQFIGSSTPGALPPSAPPRPSEKPPFSPSHATLPRGGGRPPLSSWPAEHFPSFPGMADGKAELTAPRGGRGVEGGEGEAGGRCLETRGEERPGGELCRGRGGGLGVEGEGGAGSTLGPPGPSPGRAALSACRLPLLRGPGPEALDVCWAWKRGSRASGDWERGIGPVLRREPAQPAHVPPLPSAQKSVPCVIWLIVCLPCTSFSSFACVGGWGWGR